MFDLSRDHPQIEIQVQSLNEKPAKGGQHGVVHRCCHRHTRAVVSKVCDGLIYQEEQVQVEHGNEEVHQELSRLACFPFPVERVRLCQRKPSMYYSEMTNQAAIALPDETMHEDSHRQEEH